MSFEARHHHAMVQKQVQLHYWLWLPADYETNPAVPYPLILFLHGSGERGDDLALVHEQGLTKHLQSWPDCPFIVVAPQCPLDSVWAFQLDALDSLLTAITQMLRVDATRIYLTGLSLGGGGTWLLAARHPERFAAIAPICGHGIGGTAAQRLQNLPIWIFHGEADPVVPVTESQVMAEKLHALGTEVRLTIYPGVRHNSWAQTYANPDLYAWFLQHRKAAD